MLGDIRVVNYSLGELTGNGPHGPIGASNSSGGLYRSDIDRLQFYAAMQQGQSDATNSAERLSPEVVDLKFTYYNGSTPNDTWDSVEQGTLPTAIRVSVSIRSRTGTGQNLPLLGGSTAAKSDDARVSVYEMLVDLPNAAVPSDEFQSLSNDQPIASSDSGAAGPVRASNASGARGAGGRGRGQNGQGKNGQGKNGQGKNGQGTNGRGRGRAGQGNGRNGNGQQGQNGQGQGGRANGRGGNGGPGEGPGTGGRGSRPGGQGAGPGGLQGGGPGGNGGGGRGQGQGAPSGPAAPGAGGGNRAAAGAGPGGGGR
jgi:hypothetical protein